MIVDTSAVVAAIYLEKSRDRIVEALNGEPASMGAATLFEAELVICSREGPAGRAMLVRLTAEFEIGETPFDDRQRAAAAHAFLRFGKGRHPAGLNYGDCMSYAAAKVASEPLLCVGDDFVKTDLELVLPPD